MEIERGRVKEKVSDSEGILAEVLQKLFISRDAKSVSSPLTPHFKLSPDISPKTVDEHEYISHTPVQ